MSPRNEPKLPGRRHLACEQTAMSDRNDERFFWQTPFLLQASCIVCYKTTQCFAVAYAITKLQQCLIDRKDLDI
jgi:hypothetical protein